MIITLLLFLSSYVHSLNSQETWIRAGYWDSVSEMPVSDINSALFTHLVCGFSSINYSTYKIHVNSSKEPYFSTFTGTVRVKNPSVKTLLSISARREGLPTFSSMINQSSYRKSFIESSIYTARIYGFDGLDLSVGPSISINMTNLGTLFDEWRVAIASDSRKSDKSQLLLNFTDAHAALYGPSNWVNTDEWIQDWLRGGLSASKLVLGLPYHGYAWRLENPNENAIGAPSSGPDITSDGSMGYKSIKFVIKVAQNWVKAGYWYCGSDFPISDINSALFTHLICAFANINSSTYELSIPSNFEQSFSIFTGIVKRKNPSIVTLLSIWDGQAETYKSILGEAVNSSVLSSMLAQSSYRKSFIESSVKTARTFGFQGIDLFWLWPDSTDLSNTGTLLDEWRATVDFEPRNSSVSKLILTMGVRYSPSLQSVSYPINSMKRNLDWAHVVAYDYHMPSRENFTGNHAALYNPSSNISTDFGIREWLGGGYPASKLVLGMPYHGYAWKLVNPTDNSLGAPASGPGVTIDDSMGFRFIRSFIQNYGYGARSVYNSTYVVNYFVAGSTWINFDDVETVRAKISYAKEKGLLGYNEFEVINDDNWALSLAAQVEVHQGKRSWLWLKMVLPIALISILLASLMFYYRSRLFERKAAGTRVLGDKSLSGTGTSLSAAAENFDSDAPALQVFSFESIKAATNNFSSENHLGEGGFGPVYKVL
ncbi:hypothetical protein SADUNF_Sadunf18G0090700 [Salix dunnii]|uniref:GH18 domain-containing protein n=1 Tax=Salix dunnii TaxID=1413687 RepID=A0A835J464_9ROSI|nr:hypothetical protein SADUNF_Sadunf18G0090700 [Salix dunnii]